VPTTIRGNSRGASINPRGQLTGVNSQTLSISGGNIDMSLALCNHGVQALCAASE
jgi:S1-C subfamily serine protease